MERKNFRFGFMRLEEVEGREDLTASWHTYAGGPRFVDREVVNRELKAIQLWNVIVSTVMSSS